MKLKKLFCSLLCLSMAGTIAADDDIMITRDGSMITVRVEKISSSQVTFVDLKHRKRGRLNAPTDFVYMIMKEKGNNIFFDVYGNQTTSPAVKFDKKDNVMFLNSGKMFVIYNVSVGKDEIIYQTKDRKKAAQYKISKKEVFMILNSDGTATLYNDSYQKRQDEQKATAAKASTLLATQTVQASQSILPPQESVQKATEMAHSQSINDNRLLAVATDETDFSPAPGMDAAEIEKKVNAINPYTLYRKGSVAEYCFQYKGKQSKWMGVSTYYQQIVSDERIENGQLVAYIKGALFNKEHEPSKGISSSFKESLFPVEIDTAGTYHLTHNLVQDNYLPTKRRGYGILVPGIMQQGMRLKTSTLFDDAKNALGGIVKVETVYSDWQVAGEDMITTPAGTFDCVKLTGHLAQKQGNNGKFIGERVTCWVARGIGIVQYESIADSDSNNEPFVVYLNKIDIK